MQGVLTLIRTDAGTENVEIHAIQVALRLGHRDSMSGYRSVSIGRSTSNQTIEILRRTVTKLWWNMFLSLVHDNMLKQNRSNPFRVHSFMFLICGTMPS